MKNLNLKYFIFILVFLSFIIYSLVLILNPFVQKTFLNYLRILPNVVWVDLIFIFIFSQWIWKWKIFKGWLVPFPNLNGTWKGEIQSTWRNPETNERVAPIPVILTINQSFLKISCVMRTEEMTSYSFVSDFLIDKDSQVKKLAYSYYSRPKQTVRHRSEQHNGTIIFEIIEIPEKALEGDYWTERKTSGEIKLKYWKTERLESYPVEIGNHPLRKDIESD